MITLTFHDIDCISSILRKTINFIIYLIFFTVSLFAKEMMAETLITLKIQMYKLEVFWLTESQIFVFES